MAFTDVFSWLFKKFSVYLSSLNGSRVQLCVMLWTVAHQAPLSMEFSRQESWSGLPLPPLGDLADTGIETMSPALQVNSLTADPPAKPIVLRISVSYRGVNDCI